MTTRSIVNRIEVDRAMDICRGTVQGDVVKARRVVVAAGFHPDDLTPANERESMRERMGVPAGGPDIHWDPNHPHDLVFPAISKAQAVAGLKRIEANMSARARARIGGR